MNPITLIKAKKRLIAELNKIGITCIRDYDQLHELQINNTDTIRYEELVRRYNKDPALRWLIIQYEVDIRFKPNFRYRSEDWETDESNI